MNGDLVPLDQELIELSEYQSRAVQLDDADHDYLLDERAKWISVRSTIDSDVFVLDPGPHVGVVVLPSGRRIRCNPKVKVQNVFVMIGSLLDPRVAWWKDSVDFEVIDDVFDFFVNQFVDLVEDRLRHGLYRTYVEREENLLTVRGRIDIGKDIRRNHLLRHRTYCQFQEFTRDVPENQVIRQAVHVASAFVRKKELRRSLAVLDSRLGEIDPTPLPLSVFDRFTYHRLIDDYEPIHRLARLILQGVSVSERFGEITFRSFLLNMNQLFEDYVTESLRVRCPTHLQLKPEIGGRQFSTKLDRDERVTIRPDLVYLERRKPVAVGDCKYKKIEDERFIHHDLYQMFAYCTALALPRGALIYPKHEEDNTGTITVRNANIEIRNFSVDLGVEMGALEVEMDRLADELIGWAAPAAKNLFDAA